MKKAKKGSVNVILCGILALIFLGIGSVAVPKTESSIEETINTENVNTEYAVDSYEELSENVDVTVSSGMEVHFIDVGQADAALVLCDGDSMLIDGGNKGDSDLIYTYLKKLGISHLNYIIATHAHEDHVGGLAGALNYAEVGTVYSPVTTYESDAFSDFKKYVEERNAKITVPAVGDCFELGNAEVEILGLNAGNETNETSIILKVTHGDISFLFTGDAEREGEQAVLNSGCDLGSTVLKVGHHGSANSTTYPFLREVMPAYAVISVGEGNTYGHPTEEALSRLRDAEVKVFRTDLQGDIIAVSDGREVTFNVKKNADADTLGLQAESKPKSTSEPTPAPGPEPTPESASEPAPGAASDQKDPEVMVWIPQSGKKYHSQSGCSGMENPTQVTLDKAKELGYTACKKCH